MHTHRMHTYTAKPTKMNSNGTWLWVSRPLIHVLHFTLCPNGNRQMISIIDLGRWGAGVDICLEQCADLHIAQLIPLPRTVSCFTKIQIGFTFLVPAHLGSPGQRAVKRVCVCVCFGNSVTSNCSVNLNEKHDTELFCKISLFCNF